MLPDCAFTSEMRLWRCFGNFRVNRTHGWGVMTQTPCRNWRLYAGNICLVHKLQLLIQASRCELSFLHYLSGEAATWGDALFCGFTEVGWRILSWCVTRHGNSDGIVAPECCASNTWMRKERQLALSAMTTQFSPKNPFLSSHLSSRLREKCLA